MPDTVAIYGWEMHSATGCRDATRAFIIAGRIFIAAHYRDGAELKIRATLFPSPERALAVAESGTDALHVQGYTVSRDLVKFAMSAAAFEQLRQVGGWSYMVTKFRQLSDQANGRSVGLAEACA